MPVSLHPTAVVDPAARLGADVSIGPFCVVGPDVELGDGVRLISHVVVDGRTRIGSGTVIYPFASIGLPPQDLKYRGEPSELVIGRNNRIREHVTMNPGTEGGGMLTSVGDGGLFMVGVHIGHDCRVGNGVIFANNATLGGHVEVGDYTVIGGLSAVHQFVRIGAHAMIGGMTGVEADVVPFGLVKGERGHLAGLNLVGLERRGFAKEEIHGLRHAFKQLFGGEGTLADRTALVAESFPDRALVAQMLAFLAERGSRALTLPR
ncbi:acyl-ACP--UDP-N-acetylglucosamine O-acyltransferase [Oleisolibacter albus]|uniref:acyl-ACP--UDP-N-acetylglucosamine O-acyltransferase n=1 Tax=Oleisolibacter albus TaxID=2171757 RepID=UPI000DF22A37|nr:acyl-ACP--UDP-N-acetylglucosamine O-acyltransferase [Oleisolibacter albus]